MMNKAGLTFYSLMLFILLVSLLYGQTGQVVNSTHSEARASIPSHYSMIFPNSPSGMIMVNSAVNGGITHIPFIIQTNITPLNVKIASQTIINKQNTDKMFFLIQEQNRPVPGIENSGWKSIDDISNYVFELKGPGEHRLHLWVKAVSDVSLPDSKNTSSWQLILAQENKMLTSHNITIESANTK